MVDEVLDGGAGLFKFCGSKLYCDKLLDIPGVIARYAIQ